MVATEINKNTETFSKSFFSTLNFHARQGVTTLTYNQATFHRQIVKGE